MVENTITEIIEKEKRLGGGIEVEIPYNSLFHYLPFFSIIPNHLPGLTYNISLFKNGAEEKLELYGLIIENKNGKYSIKNSI